MVPLKLKIDESFFLPEERDGYLVSAERKKVWAVELDLLNEFSRVCENHHLKWFVHAGTMLGAMRHHGFIPWDDDIDVIMPRSDYESLCALGPSSFKYPYFFQTDDTDQFFCRNFARLRNSNTTAIQIWEKDFRFPYNQGVFIDVFPYDNLANDKSEREEEFKKMELLANIGWQYRNMVHFYHTKKGKGLYKGIAYYIKHLWYKYVNKDKGNYLRILQHHKMIATAHNCEDTEFVGEIIIPPFGRHLWKKEWVERVKSVSFEMLKVFVPENVDACLDASYGKDWRVPKQVNNCHGQVFFDVNRPYTEYTKKEYHV